MSKRRKSREIAMQALYQYDIGNDDIDYILTFPWLKDKLHPDIKDYAIALIKGTYENLNQIDNIIKPFLNNWDLSRIYSLEKAILRFSTYSLLYQKDIPYNVIINEAIELSKKFCEEDSYKFINGILDEIRKGLRKE